MKLWHVKKQLSQVHGGCQHQGGMAEYYRNTIYLAIKNVVELPNHQPGEGCGPGQKPSRAFREWFKSTVGNNSTYPMLWGDYIRWRRGKKSILTQEFKTTENTYNRVIKNIMQGG